VAITAGSTHTCALTVGGGVKCWGSNGGGQLGDGTTTDSTTPVDVSGLESGIVAISAGGQHSCAVTTAGGVKCWGGNDFGGLGNGSKDFSTTPVDVSGLGSGVIAVEAGLIHTCALTTAGSVKCWGYNSFGGLGNGETSESLVPVEVDGLASGVSAIATGYEHSCALTTRGGVKCWGSGNGSALGNGSTAASLTPVDVLGLASGATAIAAGPDHACAATRGGAIKCWGGNYGNTPVDIGPVPGDITALAGGAGHSCALTGDGGVVCWGGNHYGQLGNGSTTESAVLVEVSGLAGGIAAIDAGYDHTCALNGGGEVRCWGDNWTGQLGDGRPCESRGSSVVPVGVAFIPPSSDVEAVPTHIGHGLGPTDVVLRIDAKPDLGVGELDGETFQPGPEFTLYGDGTAIFRNGRGPMPPAERSIVRARPFTIAHLTQGQVQALLLFAIGEGGLTTACDRYESRDTDGSGSLVINLHTAALDRRIESFGENPLGPLIDRLLNLDSGGSVPTAVWEPDRFRGTIFDVDPANYGGVLPDPEDFGTFAWPWPGLGPEDFVRPEGPDFALPSRVMSAAESGVHGFSKFGGLVNRVYLVGPDRKTLYYFAMWPVFPDETS
jgi:alpha-tubulin suppressor-like RCC1 family protein